MFGAISEIGHKKFPAEYVHCYQNLQMLGSHLPSLPCDLTVRQKAWHFNKSQTCIKNSAFE